jgi:hypothetical protein
MGKSFELVNNGLAQLAQEMGVTLSLDVTQFPGAAEGLSGYRYHFGSVPYCVGPQMVSVPAELLSALIVARNNSTYPIYIHDLKRSIDELSWVQMFPRSPHVMFMFQLRVYYTRGTSPNLEGLTAAIEKIVVRAWRANSDDVLAKVGEMFAA